MLPPPNPTHQRKDRNLETMTNDPINPGEGWRILKPDEQPKEGDEVAMCATWTPIDNPSFRTGLATVRRRIERTREQKDNEALTEFLRIHGGGPPYSMTWFAALAYARKGEEK